MARLPRAILLFPLFLLTACQPESASLYLEVRGNGTATESTSGVTCPGACQTDREPSESAEPFRLTATADPGWTFTRWEPFDDELISGVNCGSGDLGAESIELEVVRYRVYECRAVFEPGLMQYELPAGDVDEPTIDLLGVVVGHGGGRLGIGLRTAGGPAPDSAYSNFVRVQVRCGDDPDEVSLTVQRHDGEDATLVENVGEARVLHVETEWGWYLEMPMRQDWAPGDLLFTVTAGYLATPDSEYQEDGSGELQGQDVEEVEDILSEIHEVLVPA